MHPLSLILTMLGFFLSLILTAFISIGIKLTLRDNGLGAFPVLTFLIVAIVSYIVTASLLSAFHL